MTADQNLARLVLAILEEEAQRAPRPRITGLGRPRRYLSNADRQRAYRLRQQEREALRTAAMGKKSTNPSPH
jgi:hypothetical protein